MNLFKIVFLMTLFMGTMISVSSFTWLGTWMGLEINLLSFIPLLKKKNCPYSSESSIKYFLVQALASSVFFLSIMMIMMESSMINESIMNPTLLMIINSALLTKMGAAPFHFWFPEVMNGLTWINSLILMTWQKIAPMMILSYTMKLSEYIMFIIIMCSIIGSIGGLNQTSLRKILAFSSINHIGWMISSFLMNEFIWMIYFSIYSIISVTLILMLNSLNVFQLKQMFVMMSKSSMIKFSMMINLLSLGGLPPFLGFFPKWMIIQQLSKSYILLILVMIMMTMITLFFYLRITYSSLIMSHNELNFNPLPTDQITNLNFISSFISITGLAICTLIFNFI
uniref:NADH-ubiquinone oxidoreductase chain 2 n=1 Tax=Manticora tibialis TaxID=1343345 RepID=A0A343EZ12_9CARA|nr:NADH dehydrogenase subunit 2 [Manticora tibialis]ASN65989.1 NADH dehydrogenase subunit 2 [Manticora tibialis]